MPKDVTADPYVFNMKGHTILQVDLVGPDFLACELDPCLYIWPSN